MNNYLKQSIIIILISVFLSVIRYFFIYDTFDLIKKNKTISEIDSLDELDISSLETFIDNLNEPTIIELSIAIKLYNNNLATFIDARTTESYLEGHIKGAINIPFDDIESIEREYDLIFMNELGENYIYNVESSNLGFVIGINNNRKFIKNIKNINNDLKDHETIFIIYCSGEGCTLSEDLAFYMSENLGFNKILIYEGGIPEWTNKGYPVE